VSSATSGKQNNHSIGTCINDITHMHHFNMSQWPLAGWDCGFESRRGNGCLSIVNVVCCQVEVCANSRSLVRGVLPKVVCLSVIVKPRSLGGPGPLGLLSNGGGGGT